MQFELVNCVQTVNDDVSDLIVSYQQIFYNKFIHREIIQYA